MVFAHLVHSQLEPLLEFLCSLPGPTGKPALEFVMTEWMSRQHLFYGQYEGKVRSDINMLLVLVKRWKSLLTVEPGQVQLHLYVPLHPVQVQPYPPNHTLPNRSRKVEPDHPFGSAVSTTRKVGHVTVIIQVLVDIRLRDGWHCSFYNILKLPIC